MIIIFFLASIPLVLTQTTAQKLGELDITTLDELWENKYLKEGQTLLIAVKEVNKIDEPFGSEFNKLKKSLQESHPDVKIFAIGDPKFDHEYSLFKFPQVIFYRNGRFVQFKGTINVKNILDWMDSHHERVTKELTDANFEHDTQASTGSTTGDWFVMFSSTGCRTAKYIESSWEHSSIKLKNRVLFAYVNFEENPGLQERFSVFNSPTLIFFKGGRMYRYELSNFEETTLVSFATVAYKNMKSDKVPGEITLFDKIVDGAVNILKKQNLEQNKPLIYIAGIVIVLISILIIYIKFFKKTKAGQRYSYESKEYQKLE